MVNTNGDTMKSFGICQYLPSMALASVLLQLPIIETTIANT
jgi:hypothetical protein